jgi:hypothetical protein
MVRSWNGDAHSDFRLALGLLSGGIREFSGPTCISLQFVFEMTQRGCERERIINSFESLSKEELVGVVTDSQGLSQQRKMPNGHFGSSVLVLLWS